MLNAKPMDTSMDLSVKLVPDQGESCSNPWRCRQFVGILYIAFVVGVLSQFLNSLLSRSLAYES